MLLLNVSDESISGTVRFLSPAGFDETVNLDFISGSTFVYSIPPRTSRKLRAVGQSSMLVGSVVVTPDQGQFAAIVSTVYAYASNGITISSTGAAAISTDMKFDVYAHLDGALGAIGSIQTGVAVANASSEPVEVNFELVRLDGSTTGISGKLQIAANGQSVSFIRELPGAANLATPFKGVLRLASSTPIAVMAIRGRYNERGEFLLSTTPPANPALSAGSEAFIPQIVDGGGYSTEIVIYDLQNDQPVSGYIYFFDQNGQPVDSELQSEPVVVLPIKTIAR
jgi:hypothetical protein